MKRIVLSLVTLFALAIATSAQGLAVGSAMVNFSLSDLNGNMQTLGGLKGGNGTVVIFLSPKCLAVKGYKDRINVIASAARERGVNFVGINSTSSDSLAWLRSNTSEFGYRFPILIDQRHRLADTLGARTAPEVFFIDRENVLRYHGPIDNDRTGRNVTANYLTDALAASRAGRPIANPSVPPSGCDIKSVGL